jgi:hypothetical protein
MTAPTLARPAAGLLRRFERIVIGSAQWPDAAAADLLDGRPLDPARPPGWVGFPADDPIADLRAAYADATSCAGELRRVLDDDEAGRHPLGLSAGFRTYAAAHRDEMRAAVAEAIIATAVGNNGRADGHERHHLPDDVTALADRVLTYRGGRAGRDSGLESLIRTGEIPPAILRGLSADALLRLGADPQAVRARGCQPLTLAFHAGGPVAQYRDALLRDLDGAESEADRLAELISARSTLPALPSVGDLGPFTLSSVLAILGWVTGWSARIHGRIPRPFFAPRPTVPTGVAGVRAAIDADRAARLWTPGFFGVAELSALLDTNSNN